MIENFWNKRNTNWLDKNKENINKNWQPKKWIALVNSELSEAWYNPATKQDIEANYMQMLQLWKKDLLDLVNDESKPMLVRIISKNMLSGKWFDIIEKMLDRGIWKPKQSTDITSWWEVLKFSRISEANDEELIKILKDGDN